MVKAARVYLKRPAVGVLFVLVPLGAFVGAFMLFAVLLYALHPIP